jgi:putative ABC transport system substrate-binding protein
VTALLQETKVIPIVFAAVTDPIGQGFVKSLARPGGNVTGFTQHEFVLGKFLEIIKEIAPSLNRLAFVFSPNLIRAPELIRDLKALASSLGVTIIELPLQNPADILDAFRAFATEPNGGVLSRLIQFCKCTGRRSSRQLQVTNYRRYSQIEFSSPMAAWFHLGQIG